MRVFAYCARTFAEVTRRAAGVAPRTSPPVSTGSFDPGWLAERDLVYFDLHGEPNAAVWFGDDAYIALTAEQIRGCALDGAVVFATNCYLADEVSPMMEALLEAGARYVIAGPGRNWGPADRDAPPGGDAPPARLYGAPLMGMWVRRLMAVGMEPLRALRMARIAVRVGAGRMPAVRDTVAFRAYRRDDEETV